MGVDVDIIGHRLVNTPGDGVTLEHREGKASPFGFSPTIALIHYGVTDSLDALWRAQHQRGFFAHVSIDGCWTEHGDDGLPAHSAKVIQSLCFNQRGSHAGASAWGGKPHVNGFALGIEISNPGPLHDRDGELFTVYGKRWSRDQAIQAKHRFPSVPFSWWAKYTDEEIDLCVQLVGLWRQHYGITDVRGHDDVAVPRGRKIDPGPAFPIQFVRDAVFGPHADTIPAGAP